MARENTACPSHDVSESGLISWLASATKSSPNREVLIEHVGTDRRVVTLGELFEHSLSLAAGLSALGITEGDIVAIWLPNQVEWMVTEFACAALGVTVLGLNTRFKSHEVSHLLNTVTVTAIVLPEEFLGIDYVATLGEAIDSIRANRIDFIAPQLIFVGDVPPGALDITPNVARYADIAAIAALTQWTDHPHAPSNLFTTSGSTSAPKVAGHDQASIVRHSRAGARALGVRDGDRILGALPLCGVFGFNAVMALLFGGASAVLMRVFDGAFAGELLQAEAITHVVGGDEMLSAVFSAIPAGVELPALRRGGIANFVGRAREVVENAEARWDAKISGVYGSSELFALSAIWPEDRDAGARALGGGVLVDPGIQLRIVDIDTEEPVEDGVPGELQFRGYNTITKYLNNQSATDAALTSDGWFRTGDLGYINGDGFVYQCRAREALRLRGFLVEPGEIEEYFSENPDIEEVHVVGIDTDSGTLAVAFVKPRDGSNVDESALLEDAKRHLANYKVPTRIVKVAEFPTTTGTNGTKVRFEELRETGRDILHI
jgi:acyl-CoA synthetase (AMP-forming)/AMP-acid ligase II